MSLSARETVEVLLATVGAMLWSHVLWPHGLRVVSFPVAISIVAISIGLSLGLGTYQEYRRFVGGQVRRP